MLDLTGYQKEHRVHLIRLFSQKPDAVAALMARENGERYVCRLYAHPVPGYEAACTLDVPQLPRVYRCAAAEGGWLVEEEFVDGIRLSELLELYHPDERQTCAIALHLCAALSALHGRGIIHRDVKPENVLVTSSGRVVLIDLDATSQWDPEKARDTRLLGTVGYAAPEQFGFGRSDVRTDIFGMGVLMNTMLTGGHPAQTLASGSLRPVIERCIAVNVDQRYPDAESLARSIRPLAGADARCPDCGFVSPGGGCLCCGKPSQPVKKNRPWYAAAAVAAAAVLALAWLLPSPQAPQAEQPALESNIQTVIERTSLPITYENENFVFQQQLPPTPVPFSYDLEGDGTAETYYFGLLQNEREEALYSMWDSVGRPYDENDYVFRTAAPAVFEKTADGRFLAVEAFADLIVDPDITVYSVDLYFGDEGTMPDITAAEPLYGIWQGAEYIEYRMGCIGGWVIEATATIDGVSYTAFTLTEIRTDWRGIPLA